MRERHSPPPFAKRSLGQNFLTDDNMIRKIIRAIHPVTGEKIIEIGPGRGALTTYLAESGCELTAIETDHVLAALLTESFAGNKQVNIHDADALKSSWQSILPAEKIVGNLPYNIASQLIIKSFAHYAGIREAVFMVQKEFAERLTAYPGSKAYGIISVYAALYSETSILFHIPPTVFKPVPHVDSSLIHILFKKELALRDIELETFHQLVRTAFNQRRKTLRNSLKIYYVPELETQFPWHLRADAISPELYIDLYKLLAIKL